ncbi:MAG: hypothetical protein ABWX92_04390 [Mycetocola sp.]
MTVFNHDAADKARAANPSLTIFDTGQMLEPKPETTVTLIEHPYPGSAPSSVKRKTGVVEFTNEHNQPVLSVVAHPSLTDDDTTLVRIETPVGGRFKIVLNDREIWVGEEEANTNDIDPRAAKEFRA